MGYLTKDSVRINPTDWYNQCLFSGDYSYCHYSPSDPVFAHAQMEHGCFPTFLNDNQRMTYNFIHGTHY